MVLELQQANPEDVQLLINSKELRIMRSLNKRIVPAKNFTLFSC